MRRGITLATATAAVAAMSVAGARAEDWCGYVPRPKAMIECGYSSVAECESAIGKGGMCFINPDYAHHTKRALPAIASTFDGRRS